MINTIFNLVTGPIRIGVTISKTLVFLWLKRDLESLKGKLGIDLAGGLMANKKFFKTKKYICVDLDKKKLMKGLKNFPDAIVVNDKIESFIEKYNQEKPDLLVCIQTMGINTKFDHNKTLTIVKMIYDLLKPGGSMVFNIGSIDINIDFIEKELIKTFKGKFKSTQIKSYGWLSKTNDKANKYFYYMIANLMNLFPPLRTCFGLSKKNIYCCFKKKL